MNSCTAIVLTDVATGESIPAELRQGITQANLDDWVREWKPAMARLVNAKRAAGAKSAELPQTSGWDWEQKVRRVQGLLAFQAFAVVAGGKTQGLMRVDLNRTARIPNQAGKPLVYIEYLEVAPWNRSDVTGQQLRGVGSALVTAAIELSVGEEFAGRVALHSLPQSESFYREACQMTDLGDDPDYDELRYFEMTAEQSAQFTL